MAKPQFQFGLKAVFVAMTSIAVLFGVGIYWPTETIVVVVCVVLGAASLLLSDLRVKWAKSSYRAEARYFRSRRNALEAAYIAIVGSAIGIVLGIISIWSSDKKGWGVLFASLMLVAVSVLCFRTARTRRQHWLEAALYNEERREGREDTLPPPEHDK
jgi:hypothetical protein